jgi:hypothetical protein
MSSTLSAGSPIQKAAAYVAETRQLDPSRSLSSILDEAGMRFNLTPLDSEALNRLFSDSPKAD